MWLARGSDLNRSSLFALRRMQNIGLPASGGIFGGICLNRDYIRPGCAGVFRTTVAPTQVFAVESRTPGPGKTLGGAIAQARQFLDIRSAFPLGHTKLIKFLQVQPELGARPEEVP